MFESFSVDNVAKMLLYFDIFCCELKMHCRVCGIVYRVNLLLKIPKVRLVLKFQFPYSTI
jgi:hypothetical protein